MWWFLLFSFFFSLFLRVSSYSHSFFFLHLLDGYNACVMAYGQTGSGKSFTMMDGSGDQYGISYRTIQKLFEVLETKKSNKNGSNKNLLALTAKSPLQTPKTTNKKELKSNSSNSFEFVNPMNAGGNINNNKDSRRSSRTVSPGGVPSHRASFSSGTPPNVPISSPSSTVHYSGSKPAVAAELTINTSSDSIELGIAYDHVIDDEFSDKISELDGSDDEGDEKHFSYTMEISMLEIYNENVYDLLNDNFGGGQTDGLSLDLRTTPENVVIVPGK
jgi:hypothetical protein